MFLIFNFQLPLPSWPECVPVVCELRRRDRGVHGDDVEAARRVVEAMRGDVLFGHRGQASLFLLRHGLDWIAESAIGLGLHFDKYYRAAVVGDDIDLAEPRAITPFQNGVSALFELLAGHRFSALAEPLSLIGHAADAASGVPKHKHRMSGGRRVASMFC